MKKILAIIFVVITLLSLSSCMSKYSTIYCDFNTGNFDSAGYYILKNKQDIDKFKENHLLTNDFVSKLESKDINLNKTYLIVLIMPKDYEQVKYEIKNFEFSKGKATITIKILNRVNESDNDSNKDENLIPDDSNGNLGDEPGEDNLNGNVDSEKNIIKDNANEMVRISKGFILKVKNKNDISTIVYKFV